MKAFVIDSDWDFTKKYVNYTDCNGNDVMKVVGLEMDLLTVVLQQLNMPFVLVTLREIYSGEVLDLYTSMYSKKAHVILGDIVEHSMVEYFLDATKHYSLGNIRWYVPCSIKLPRWSSILIKLSVELWLVLII